MSKPVEYLTNEQGERVGVLLDWNTYSRFANSLGLDEDCLIGLSVDELKALASCQLSLVEQTRLDDLVTRNAESLLCADEVAELDELLAKTDQLTILKNRARYTLKCGTRYDGSVSVYIRMGFSLSDRREMQKLRFYLVSR
ncbi:hypothetical protein [Microcystis aeruginosa]|uniref:hypothetical protein n=2 Tax=Microcystis TaxID=1125 RepID=UPI001F4F7BE0|nr:hypothetical protein [Microcystis aeruginosa]